ncbi:hypothetical protein NSMM_360028 [Nitrosomonas mobilis]|uniref:Uncharacterized protein n=1 Tax=Nitrosomonas mobilis TaxID=51642 RepID=A0A1G5SDE1_9PROT|nr:hypothetical protein NSMM_360028 [Nitrosomonas mobilis]
MQFFGYIYVIYKFSYTQNSRS